MRKLWLVTGAFVFAPAMATAQAGQSGPATTSSVVPIPDTKLPLKHAPRPTGPGITAQDLMTRLYIIADDSMQGRETGTIGNVKGTDYIASEARKIGLVPGGENGTYFQTLPFKTRATSASSTFTIAGASLAIGTDWVTSAKHEFKVANAPIVYGGVIGDTLHLIEPSTVAGKIVVFRLSGGSNTAALETASRLPEAAAIVIVGLDQFMPYFNRTTRFVDDPAFGADEDMMEMMAPAILPPQSIIVSTAAASKLFDGAMGTITPGSASKTASINVKIDVAPVAFPARNVVGIIPGSDRKLKGEYVAIGAHNDHLGFNMTPVDHDSLRIFNHIVLPGGAEQMGKHASPAEQAEVNQQLAAWRAAHPDRARPDSIFNGADDDGSGSISLLEIAEKLASLNTKPKRAIIFVWHIGEEEGLLGSTYFTQHPTVPRDSIVAQLNIDMVGRGDPWDVTGETKDGQTIHGGSDYVQLVGSRRLSTELGNLAETVNRQDHHDLKFDYSMDANGHPQNYYCRSDHYSYARFGIPIIFFTTGGHSSYHQVTDEPQYIDYPHMARVDRFIEDLAEHIANMDHRLVVDHPKPDPRAACTQ